MQHIPCRHFVGMAAGIVFPHAFIKAVVEIKMFHGFKLSARGRKQLLAQLDMRIH